MPKPTGPTNPKMKELIDFIREKGFKEKSNFLLDLARYLSKPRRKSIAVNIEKLERYGKEDKILVIPGKLLSSGNLSKPLNIVALKWSKAAKDKILKSGGNIQDIKTFITQTNDYSNVIILV
ncbi:MAG: 50S ribosomal protein L18e [Candidatus Aenigmatarchaeota archaeon]|nr:50S ribosomal protein L18e [Candidatus Aenigmarchaeota archaeon]